jgi:hypothetical protein
MEEFLKGAGFWVVLAIVLLALHGLGLGTD